jgi:hypothetical protein
VSKTFNISAIMLCLTGYALAQSPSVSQVLVYSATTGAINIPGSPPYTLQRAVPSIFTENRVSTNLSDPQFNNVVSNGSNYTVSQNIVQLNNALNASISTALSLIPLSSPASGVIVRKDPDT